ncbi:MAG: hypothetical protein HY518_02485 [Candidatus Aenigmarchaeota archaeon]|nr:hypothetical protein [Candidatus Aenigmarchaeota archaeon]
MAEQEILNYLRENLKKGYSVASLKQTLVQAGWTEKQVNEALIETQKPQAAPARPQAGAPVQQAQPGGLRPLGVTLISILGLLGSIATLLGSIALLGIGTLAGGVIGGPVGVLAGVFAMVMGIISLVVGIIGFIGYLLFFKMKKLGWIFVVIVSILGIVITAIQIALTPLGGYIPIFEILFILWPILVLIYCFKRKALFA